MEAEKRCLELEADNKKLKRIAEIIEQAEISEIYKLASAK